MLAKLVAFASLALSVSAQDPADSWLVYAIAPGNGSRILSVNATWVVPQYPTTRQGGNAPGWWFGIESPARDILIQPILAYGDGADDYTVFTGLYVWSNGDWVQSTTQTVNPGDTITGWLYYDVKNVAYTQCIQKVASATGEKDFSATPICTRVNKKTLAGETFTDVYFVVEHQPNTCSEYPANGNVVFYDIAITWEQQHDPVWTVNQFKPACNSQGQVLNSTALEFTWSTK